MILLSSFQETKDMVSEVEKVSTEEIEFSRQFNRKGVKKMCSPCGYYLYLCPDVKHECPICGLEMEEC